MRTGVKFSQVVITVVAFIFLILAAAKGKLVETIVGFFIIVIVVLIILGFSTVALQNKIDKEEAKKKEYVKGLDKRYAVQRELGERLEVLKIDYKYGRVPEGIYRKALLLGGYYSLEEWAEKNPASYAEQSPERLDKLRKQLREIEKEVVSE